LKSFFLAYFHNIKYNNDQKQYGLKINYLIKDIVRPSLTCCKIKTKNQKTYKEVPKLVSPVIV